MDTKKLGIKFESNNRIIEVGKGKPFRLLNIDGIESSDFELFIEDNIFYDGSRVNHKRVKGRPIMIEAEYVGKHKEVERRKLASFFNVHRNGYLIINYQGIVRKIKYEVESFKAPLRNLYEPLKFLLHIYCPNPYWLEEEKEMDLVTWIPNLEFDAVEGFSTEQLENHWIETQIKKQGLKVFKNGTIFVELEEESTVPEVEIAYLLENGQYKRLRQQATVFSTGTGYDENRNYVDVSDSIVNGQASVTLKGRTITQMLKNGNFKDGTNNWNVENVTNFTVNNGIAQFISTSAFGRIKQIVYMINGHEYYITAWVKADSSLVHIDIAGTGKKYHSGSGNWERLSNKFIWAPTSGPFPFGVRDGRSSNWTPIQATNCFVIDLTAHGLEDLSLAELDAMFSYYIDYGTKSTVSAMRIKSVGKNLFDFKKNGLKLSDYTVDLGDNYKGMPIKLIPNTTYTVQRFLNGWERDPSFALELWHQQGRIMLLNTIGEYASFTFTTDSTGIIYLRHRYGTNERLKSILSTIDIMLQIGETATPYEPYKESNTYVIVKDEEGNILELRSLPNGTRDEINVTDRKLIKRIGEKSNIANGMVVDFADMAEGGTYYAWNDNGETEIGTKGDTLGINATVLICQLANPIVKLLPPEPLTTFEEFESGFGIGGPIEFSYRLTKQIVEIENIGDVDAPIRVVFRAHGQVEKPYIQDVETREMIRINRTLEAGDVLEITTEFGNKNVYLNGQKAHHYLDFLNSTWIQLKPGTNLIKYGAENGVELLECQLFYIPRYLGV